MYSLFIGGPRRRCACSRDARPPFYMNTYGKMYFGQQSNTEQSQSAKGNAQMQQNRVTSRTPGAATIRTPGEYPQNALQACETGPNNARRSTVGRRLRAPGAKAV